MTQNANTNTGWSATTAVAANSVETHFYAVGVNVVRVYYDGGANIKYQWSQDEGTTFATAQTIDSTANNDDVMLNEPIAYDQVTGRLHILYGRNIDTVGTKPSLCYRHTDNPFNASPTWSSEVVLDDGTSHVNNSFYRVGLAAFNGNVSLHYANVTNGAPFSTDGLWRNLSSDGGNTWGGKAKVYTGTVVQAGEPNVCVGSDGSVFVTWYDDGVNNNSHGDLWIAISRDGGATWPGSATKLTTTTDYGRPRPSTSAGSIWIIANKPWNSSPTHADVWTLTSTDNGATWGSPTQRAVHSGSGDLDHPDCVVVNSFVGLMWVDTSTNPAGRMVSYSVDAGANFSSPVGVLTATSGSVSDAPRILATTNRILAQGYDGTANKYLLASNPFFALLPKVSTSLIDDFSGLGNGTTLAGGNYTVTGLGGSSMKGTGSSGIIRNAGAGTFGRSGDYRNDATYTGNVEIAVTISSTSSAGETDIFIWDPVAKSGYDINAANTATGDFSATHAMGKYTSSSSAAMGSGDTTAAVSGEVLALQVIGNYVIGFKLVSSVWYEVGGGRFLDTTYRSSLKLELEAVGNTYAGPTLGSFFGGTVSTPGSTVAPVASGTIANGSVLSVTDGSWSRTPGRFAYQWQTSSDGGATWSSVSLAVLPFFTVTDQTKQHRCQVTATNTVGASSATNSNALTPVIAAAGFMFGF